MAVKSSHIRITPLHGGRTDSGACTLLEVGGARILLDAGASLLSASAEETAYIRKLASDLVSAGGVDAILLSHADLHHIGGLPIIAGRQGVQNVPIICTVPVAKFSQLALYDYAANLVMEGENTVLPYEYDDVDHAFGHLISLKYSQLINLPGVRSNSDKRQTVTVCAIPSGRTLGGAIWRIRCGPAEIVYAMDINLRKEVVLDGASMDLLPTAPTLLITEAACASRSSGAAGKKRKDKDEMNQLLQHVMSALRSGGNVLIPCETCARVQEMLFLFSKYWQDNKLGMYHLIYLSHMSRNVTETTRTQLEWMSDSLTRGFYNGKPNPFDLPNVKCITDVRTIDRKLQGPKLVFATDASLSHGLSKDLLLRWGGDPRCRVIFTEPSESQSLAAQLRSMALTPPVILTIQRPVKEDLVGAELLAYRAEEERKRKIDEEEMQRKKRQLELSQFTAVQEDIRGEEDEEEETAARKRAKKSSIWQVLQPNLLLFEHKTVPLTMDEFGLSIDDLTFQDIQSAENRLMTDKGRLDNRAGPKGPVQAVVPIEAKRSEKASAQSRTPFKVKSVAQRVQFTCEFVDSPVNAGRMDLKAFKALIARTTPTRLFVLRGTDKDCDTLVQYAKSNGIEAYAPKNRRSATISVHTERLRVQVPHMLLPRQYARLQKGAAVTAGAMVGSMGASTGECSVYLLKGTVTSLGGGDASGQEGTRLIKYQGPPAASSAQAVQENDSSTAGKNGMNLPAALAEQAGQAIGVVSLGEVTLNQLKQQLEAQGIKADFTIGAQGGALICNDQVVIRKENNDIFIEGPPVKVFYDARKVVYQQFAFI